MDQPFLLVSVVPRKEIPITGLITDAGITDFTLLYVEESEHGVNLIEVCKVMQYFNAYAT